MTELGIAAQLSLDGDILDPVGGGGALIGYARVSTRDQNLDRQHRTLEAAGCQRVFADKKSGKNAEREELWACLD
ncbi:recombinase family protein [Nocardia sp. BMG111209]|uniref:recombinase family protein n=1 Tax=Nocardia sp. BMG111209 TaxID=1160137 RepID=UPI000366396F|nr:recombinase family protein [Nocardia sp. BMG111209]